MSGGHHIRNLAARLAKALTCLALIAFCVGGLAGCKYTDVIRQVIYNQDAEEVDPNATPQVNVIPPQDDEDQNNDRSNDDSAPDEEEQAQEDLEKTIAALGGSKDNGLSAKLKHALDGSDYGKAFEDMESGESATAQGSSESEESEGNKGDDSSGKSSSPSGAGNGTDASSEGSSMDANGSYEKLPTNIGTAAAGGELAVALCMVAGADALCATSTTFRSTAPKAIPSWTSVSTAKVVFKEDGTLTSNGASTLISLHAQGDCDAVFVESISQLGDDLTSIKDSGINVYTVSLASLDKIQSTVKAMGRLFTDATNGASVTTASNYTSFCSKVKGTSKHSGSSYTIYISDWDAKASWTVYGGNMVLASGKGVAATKTGEASVVTECLGDVGITNTPGTSAYQGVSEGLYWVSQFSKTVGTYTVKGSSLTDVSYSNRAQNPTRLFTVADPSLPTDKMLGNSGFKTVIAANVDVAKGIISSRDNGGFYSACNLLPDRIVAVKGVGLYGDDNHYALSYIGDGTKFKQDCYKVYTSPQGLCSSWTDGGVESILFEAWAAWKYNGTKGFEGYVRDFYQQFYGVQLSDSQYASITKGAGE